MPELIGLTVADAPEAWAEIGFAVTDGAFALGGVRIALAGRDRGEGIVDWELGPKADAPAVQHPNRALALDHVVLRTPYYERTRDALVASGLDLRRERDDVRDARMAFFRVGPAVLELVGAPAAEAPRLWGLVAVLPSVDDVAPALAPHLGEPRDAVQPGRRIATLRETPGISTAVAFMTPRG